LSEHHDEKAHLPGPSLYPIGFAIGVACILTGLVVSWWAAAVGAAIALLFGFLWVRDVTRDMTAPVEVEPTTRQVAPTPAAEAEAAEFVADEEEEIPTYDRSVFLELSTLGIGAAIGGLVTLPVLGFAVLPSFTNQEQPEVNLGPMENFPEGRFVVATYLENPRQGEVTARTVYVRNNGLLGDVPSFTILYSRCVHLGCPVQPNGPPIGQKKRLENVTLTPVQPASFGCPCHGGQYDTEGRRTAGPPVRSMDRMTFSIRNGDLVLGERYSVGTVEGDGANAKIAKYNANYPGVHVDGIEAWLYPIEVPQ
jgi:quinol---cytochrome c reductase iron-sulfur subunit, bacillus type